VAEAQGLHRVPSFHPDLVRGVASAYVEFFEALAAAPDGPPEVLFVPIGLGSGFAAAAAARAHCGVSTRLVGVVSAHATAYLDSFRAGHALESPVSTRLADGMACRTPVPEALEVLRREADDVIAVRDEEVAQAMGVLFTDTHNVAEGAGAAALAALLQQSSRWRGKRVGIALTGGNVDAAVFAEVLRSSAQVRQQA
jgi:threonine dehydratase